MTPFPEELRGLICFSRVSENTHRFIERLNPAFELLTGLNPSTGTDPLKRKVAAVLLSSFLLYAGFYLPLHLSCRGNLTDTADMVRLDTSGRGQMREFIMGLLQELYELELEYFSLVFDELGMTDAVHTFVRYNANKALMEALEALVRNVQPGDGGAWSYSPACSCGGTSFLPVRDCTGVVAARFDA